MMLEYVEACHPTMLDDGRCIWIIWICRFRTEPGGVNEDIRRPTSLESPPCRLRVVLSAFFRSLSVVLSAGYHPFDENI